jgi:hypothetical protein
VEFIPLGEMFHQITPGVLISAGHELTPRVPPEVLLDRLGGGPDKLFFFCEGNPAPLQLSRLDFMPLAKRTLAPIEADPRVGTTPAREATPPVLYNKGVGLFPLWGFTDDKGKGR